MIIWIIMMIMIYIYDDNDNIMNEMMNNDEYMMIMI